MNSPVLLACPGRCGKTFVVGKHTPDAMASHLTICPKGTHTCELLRQFALWLMDRPLEIPPGAHEQTALSRHLVQQFVGLV
jgi:hypothetical protein